MVTDALKLFREDFNELANAYIGVYKGTPTLGGTDGTRVSEGDATAAISITLNATNNEVSAPIKLALRCANTPVNYQTVGNTTVSLVGTNNAKWKLILKNSDTAPTQAEIDANAYNNSLTIATVVGTTNYIFWLQKQPPTKLHRTIPPWIFP